MTSVEIIPKLQRLNDHLADLSADDRQFVIDALKKERLRLADILRIVAMRVPGEDMPVDPLLQEGTVSVEREYLSEIIWQYMPLEKFFALLCTQALHFSPLAFQSDPNEGKLSERAFEEAKAQLPAQFRDSNFGVTDTQVTANLECHRRETISISCWYMRETDSLEMWGTYAPRNGVAIRTTVQRLFSSLQKVNNTNIHITKAIYLPEREDEYVRREVSGNVFIKPAEKFQSERELRALAPNGTYRYGVDIPVTLSVLIESLLLSPELPEWAVPAFTATLRKLGVECPIEPISVLNSQNEAG